MRRGERRRGGSEERGKEEVRRGGRGRGEERMERAGGEEKDP